MFINALCKIALTSYKNSLDGLGILYALGKIQLQRPTCEETSEVVGSKYNRFVTRNVGH